MSLLVFPGIFLVLMGSCKGHDISDESDSLKSNTIPAVKTNIASAITSTQRQAAGM